MVFSSVQFLFVFLPLVLIFYYAVPLRLKNWVLLGFSLFCYGVIYQKIHKLQHHKADKTYPK